MAQLVLQDFDFNSLVRAINVPTPTESHHVAPKSYSDSYGPRHHRPVLQWAGSTTGVLVSGRVYGVYCGKIPKGRVLINIEGILNTAGAGAQACEVGIASTASAPNKTNLTWTILAAQALTADLTTGAPKLVANASSLAYTAAADFHAWALFRVAMATTQPVMIAAQFDAGQRNGLISSTDAVGALTSLTMGTSTITTANHAGGLTGVVGPYLSILED